MEEKINKIRDLVKEINSYKVIKFICDRRKNI